MVIIEKSFPRGGIVSKEQQAEKSKEYIQFGAVQKKAKKLKTKNKKEHVEDFVDDAKEDVIESISAELLNYETIQDGMIILGVVKSIDDLYMTISLPGRMFARVNALDISDAYTKVAREFLENADSGNNYKPLKELYQVGQFVYGRIQEVKQNEFKKVNIKMSLKPIAVHADLTQSNIKKGFIFNGAIEEVQEHGYIIETGIKGLRSFLPSEKSKKAHVVGELVHLKVEKLTQDKNASTCICKELKVNELYIKKQIETNLDYLLPGNIVQFIVKKKLKDGLQGTIMNEAFTGYVNEHQLQEPLALPEDYELNANIKARILYIMPLTKLVYLTLNLQNRVAVQESNDAEIITELKRGDLIDDARVHHVGTGGIILVLNNRLKGIISFKSIKANYKGNYDQDEMLAKYSKKTKLKVRVLTYDPMDALYVCTDDERILNEKVFTLEDIKSGDFVTAEITDVNEKIEGYTLKIGNIKGIIEKLFLAPSTKPLKIGSNVRCRVIAVDTELRKAYLTNRSEYMNKNSKVLTSLTDAKKNQIYYGTVVIYNPKYILVRFFNGLKGVLYRQQLTGLFATEMNNFYIGQTMQFRIQDRKDEQIMLGLVESAYKMGEICKCKVISNLESGLEINIENNNEDDDNSNFKGLVPIELLSDFNDLLVAQMKIHPPNSQIQIACINKNIFSLRDVDYFSQNAVKTWQSVQVGDILKAFVQNVSGDIIDIILPVRDYNKVVKIHNQMLLVKAYRKPNITLTSDQVIYVKVLSKESATKTLTVSAQLTDVWNSEMKTTAEYIESYLKELEFIRLAYKKQKNSITNYSLGDKVTALFSGVVQETNELQYELENTKVKAIVPASIGCKKLPKVGQKQECIVLWIDYSNELVWISNNTKDLNHITNDAELPKNLVGQSSINAKVLLIQENVFICSLRKANNPLIICPTRLHYNDFENCATLNVKEQEFCKITFISNNNKPIAVLDATAKLFKVISRKRKQPLEENEVSKAKNKKIEKSDKVKTKTEQKRSSAELAATSASNKDAVQKKSNKNLTTKPEENIAPKTATKRPATTKKPVAEISSVEKNEDITFYEDKEPDNSLAKNLKKLKKTTKPDVKLSLPGVGDFWNTDLSQMNDYNKEISSDEETETTEVPQKKKKLTAKEKFKMERDAEARLREIEEKNADPNHLPETIDQFDRLVLSDPNNSKNWISYMVFHLQATEIDKARAVAQRAIKAISFRNADERLNVWMALLSLELNYGTKESYNDTMKEALTCNEPLKVYLRALDILKDPNNKQELLDTIGILIKKFKGVQEAWKAAATAYFSIGMTERAQQMLQKALLSLPDREHVNTIVMFANLNHKFNQHELAQTLLEEVVTSYPKRVDIWTQYVDMLIKDELIDSARGVLERAVMQKIPLKKMRTLFKKYLSFEERFGTEENVKKVKNLATQYVKQNTIL